jgi:hypothetical protein
MGSLSVYNSVTNISRLGTFNAGVEKRHPWADARVRHETGHTVQVGLPANNSWHEERSQISSGISAIETLAIIKSLKT